MQVLHLFLQWLVDVDVENGMTENIFICSSFWSKKSLYSDTRHKKANIMPTIFMSVFSCLQQHTNLAILMDVKQEALILFLFMLSGPCVFDNRCPT